MEQTPPLPPAPPAIERCYRHPGAETRVHCTRCGRPICTECMIPAPVGHQCPECVGHARREFRRGPGRRAVAGGARGLSVSRVLLAAILSMFAVEVLLGGPGSLIQGPSAATMVRLGASVGLARLPDGDFIGIATGQYWRLATSMFLHAGLIHIAFNAYALWVFGQVVEQYFGRLRFIAIYALSGLLAGAVSYAFGPNSVGVGASGAIFGIFGAFVAYNYRRRDLALAAANLRSALTIIALNAFLALAFPIIDWRAHLGGLFAGFAAGAVAEGFGPRTTRRAVAIVGFVALGAVTVALVAWRTAQLRAQFPFLG
jgi:membrane associated rhomboid family serine protease